MSDSARWVYPKIGSAGLGNELFALVRAAMTASRIDATLIPARWFKIKPKRWLRRDPDPRIYWNLFRAPTLTARAERFGADLALVGFRLRRLQPRSVVIVRGMGDYFASFDQEAQWVDAFLRSIARNGAIGPQRVFPYISVHVRLGDFARPSPGQSGAQANNTSTSIDWYAFQLAEVKGRLPDMRIVVSSDGTDEELGPILKMENVTRSQASNPLDEIFTLAGSVGMIGSRSTFTAWGAYLGRVPLLLMIGGNAYFPHSAVWEVDEKSVSAEWFMEVENELLERFPLYAPPAASD